MAKLKYLSVVIGGVASIHCFLFNNQFIITWLLAAFSDEVVDIMVSLRTCSGIRLSLFLQFLQKLLSLLRFSHFVQLRFFSWRIRFRYLSAQTANTILLPSTLSNSFLSRFILVIFYHSIKSYFFQVFHTNGSHLWPVSTFGPSLKETGLSFGRNFPISFGMITLSEGGISWFSLSA